MTTPTQELLTTIRSLNIQKVNRRIRSFATNRNTDTSKNMIAGDKQFFEYTQQQLKTLPTRYRRYNRRTKAYEFRTPRLSNKLKPQQLRTEIELINQTYTSLTTYRERSDAALLYGGTVDVFSLFQTIANDLTSHLSSAISTDVIKVAMDTYEQNIGEKWDIEQLVKFTNKAKRNGVDEEILQKAQKRQAEKWGFKQASEDYKGLF